MPSFFRALPRPSAPFRACVLSLGALTLFSVAAPSAFAAPTVPVITNVTVSPNPIPAISGVFTVTAQVAPSTSGLTSVILYETYPNSGSTKRTAPMTVGTDGVT